MEWIKCSERMPEYGQWCFVVHAGCVQRIAALITTGDSESDRVWEWADDSADFTELEEITHWTPIPNPPKDLKA